MSRELIVSVNGKEKKIAIVENDRVTEFYIERGEQSLRGHRTGAGRVSLRHGFL